MTRVVSGSRAVQVENSGKHRLDRRWLATFTALAYNYVADFRKGPDIDQTLSGVFGHRHDPIHISCAHLVYLVFLNCVRGALYSCPPCLQLSIAVTDAHVPVNIAYQAVGVEDDKVLLLATLSRAFNLSTRGGTSSSCSAHHRGHTELMARSQQKPSACRSDALSDRFVGVHHEARRMFKDSFQVVDHRTHSGPFGIRPPSLLASQSPADAHALLAAAPCLV